MQLQLRIYQFAWNTHLQAALWKCEIYVVKIHGFTKYKKIKHVVYL